MDGSLFFYWGGALVLAALVLSYIGIRGKESFPPSGATLTGMTVVFAVIVVGTAAYAIANAREEKEHHEEELAAEEAEGQEAVDEGAAPAAQEGAEQQTDPGSGPPAGPGPAQTLDLTSPEDGSLVFEPAGLEAQAGSITLAYENPSAVTHNINLEGDDETLAESEDVTAGSVTIEGELAPGEYIFFCSIPGHREGGMEGTLTVE